MGRRVEQQSPERPERQTVWRGNQINTRLRVALWSVEPDGGPLTRERIASSDEPDPTTRLHLLAELVDRVRPLCQPKVREYVLPESLSVRTRG